MLHTVHCCAPAYHRTVSCALTAATALMLHHLLQLSDIPKNITKVPTAISDLSGGAKLLSHELFTNDVLYAEAALDMTGLPASLLPLVPLFCRSLTQVTHVHDSCSTAGLADLLPDGEYCDVAHLYHPVKAMLVAQLQWSSWL